MNEQIKVSNTDSKPKMKKIHHVMIIDSSGSMESVKKQTISGINEQISTINKELVDTSVENTITLVFFNGKVSTKYFMTPLKADSKLSYISTEDYATDGSTALHDAIAETLNKVDLEVGKDETVLVTIVTDGYENASQSIYRDKRVLKELINHYKNKSWAITYIGANVDVTEVCTNLGINLSNTASFVHSTEGTSEAFKTMSKARSAYMCKVKSGAGGQSLAADFYSSVEEPKQ